MAKGFSSGDLISYIAVFAMLINPAKTLSTSIFNIQRGRRGDGRGWKIC
jgi:subfamily B ATP-binding cassette protein MsbA